jgi:two-component system sensor histidine kinase VanS
MGWGIKLKNKKKRSLLSKIFMQFLLRELIIMIIVALILGVTSWIILKSDFNWLYNINYDTYSKAIELFNVVFNGFTPFLIIFLIWLILSIINIYLTLKKVFSYMNTIILSVDKLYDKNVEYINLPAELDNVEKKLNHLKSESEKNERLAKESEEKKDNLIVYLAHDIKTPLTSMIGYLSLLDEIDDMPLKQRKKYTSVALNKSYKLEELINELFDIARFNSEHIILEKEELKLNLMLEQIIDDFYPVLNELGKNIKFNTEENIIIMADPDKLSRVFNNLIKNAINYSKEESEIMINVKKEESNVLVEVKNVGKQISQEKLDKIFEKFYRLDSSRNSNTGGSGLGLAIAKDIVELHNGTITAQSDKNETIFKVILPIS